MIDEQRYRALIQQLASGGIAGNKTYHQVRDQYMPMDSESMEYANGGGVGSMMQPRMNFAGGGGDFEPLGYQDESITIEDLTNRNNGNFLISAANALDNQTGTINSAPSITNSGVNTIEGSLIDGDDPSSRYAVQQDFDSLPPSYNDPRIVSEELGITGYGKPNIRDVAGENLPSGISSAYNQATVDGYQDMIMNPEGFPNALQNLERFQDNRFSDLEFQEGFNFKDAPNEVSNLSELYQNRNFIDNPRTGFFDKNIMSKGNPDASLVNKIKQGSNGIMDFISKIPTPLNLVRNIMNPDPNAPSYKTYSPNIDYSKLNTTNLNDFYDSNPESETYGTTRFDRAKPNSFGSFRTLADYFNRNKSIVDTGKKAAADKKAQDAIKAAEKQRAKEAATADRARAANASVYASADRQGFTDGRGGGFGSRSTGTNENFSNRSGRGRTGYQDGGIVSLKK